jgi:hypothetical protein
MLAAACQPGGDGHTDEVPGGADATVADAAGDAGDDGVTFGELPAHVDVRESWFVGSEEPFPNVRAALLATAAPRADREVAREGDCRLLEPSPVGRCDAPCDAGLCVAGECLPYPPPRSAGPIEVTGLIDDLTLEFAESLGYEAHHTTPAELFVADAAIRVDAAGEAVAGFALAAAAPALADVVELRDGRLLVRGGDGELRLSWTPVEPDARIRLALAAGEEHGRPPHAVIECDVADTGALAVPAALVDAFAAPQNFGGCGRCPVSTFTRYRRDVADTADGLVELVVASELVFDTDRAGD